MMNIMKLPIINQIAAKRQEIDDIKTRQLEEYKQMDWSERGDFLLNGIVNKTISQEFLMWAAKEDPDWRNRALAYEQERNYSVRHALMRRQKQLEGWARP